MSRLPAVLRDILQEAARRAAERQRPMGADEDRDAMASLIERGMTIREIDRRAFQRPAEQLWQREARALDAASWLELIRR